MAHTGEVLSQERLLEHVWDENADPLADTVRVTVGTLRRKLTRDDDVEPPMRNRDRRRLPGCGPTCSPAPAPGRVRAGSEPEAGGG